MPVSEEEELLKTAKDAAMAVARRRLLVRDGPPITDPAAWLRKTAASVYDEHGADFRAGACNGDSVETMADRIMPPPARHYAEAEEYRPTYGEDDVTVDEHGRLIVARRVG